MALLSFRVEADYEEALKCRKEIERLEKTFNEIKLSGSIKEIETVSNELAAARSKFILLIESAEATGEKLEQKFVTSMLSIEKNVKQASASFNESKKEIEEYEKQIESLSKQEDKYRKAGNNLKANEILKEKDDVEVKRSMALDRMIGSSEDIARLQGDAAKIRNEYELIQKAGTMQGDAFGKAIADSFGEAEMKVGSFYRIFNSITAQATGVALGNILSGGLEGAVEQAINFKNQILETRKYFQDVESTMSIFLGDARKASEFTDKLQEYAYYNMFDYEQLVGASKQLIAYGNDVETIIPTLDKLSNIATGTGNSVNTLVDMFNRAKSIGYVDSRTMQTWASQGIVLKDILREMGETSDGTRVTFEQLNKAIDYLNQEGQMFGGVMEAQMDNLSASMGQLEDNLSLMRNEIGENLEGVFKRQIDFQSKLVENWKSVVKTIGFVVTAYGVYKGAVMATIALRKVENVLMEKAIALEKKNIASTTLMANAQSKAAFSLSGTTTALKAYTTQAMKAAAATMTNPYVLFAAALAAAASMIYLHVTAMTEEERAQERVADVTEKYNSYLKEKNKEEQEAVGIIANVNRSEREKLENYKKLSTILPQLTKKYSQYELSQMTPEQRQKAIEAAQKEQKEEADNTIAEAKRVSEEVTGIRERNWKGKLIDMLGSGGMEFILAPLRDYADNADNAFSDVIKKIDIVRGLSDEYLTQKFDWNLYDYDEEEAKKIQEQYEAVAEARNIASEDRVTDTREQINFLREIGAQNEDAVAKAKEEEEMLRRKLLPLQQRLDLAEKDTKAENERREGVSNLIDDLKKASEVTDEMRTRMDALVKERAIKVKLEKATSKEEVEQIIEEYLNEVNASVDSKAKEVRSINSQMMDIKDNTPDKMRAKALEKQILLQRVKSKVANGNYNFTDAELEACGVNLEEGEYENSSDFGKMVFNASKQYGNNGFGSEIGIFTEKIGTELNNIKTDLSNAGQDVVEKERKEAYKLAEMRRKNARTLVRASEDAIIAQRQAELEIERSSAEKLQKQRQLEFDKEKQRLEREKEDKEEAARETAKAVWMAENPEYHHDYDWDAASKKYLEGTSKAAKEYQESMRNIEMNFATGMAKAENRKSGIEQLFEKYGKDANMRKQFDELTDALTLLKEERDKITDGDQKTLFSDAETSRLEEINTLMGEILAKRHGLQTEEDKNRIDYTRKYGSLEERKAAEKEYWQHQVDAETDENKKMTLMEQMNTAIKAIPKSYVDERIKEMREDSDNYKVFTDIRYATTGAIENIRRELKELLSNPNITIDPEVEATIIGYLEDIDNKLLENGGLSIKNFKEVFRTASTSDKNYRSAQREYERKKKAGERDADDYYKKVVLPLKEESDTNWEYFGKCVDKFADVISELGDRISDIGDKIGGKFGEGLSAAGSIVSATSDYSKGAKDIAENYKDSPKMGAAMGIMNGISAGLEVGSTMTNYLESVTKTGGKKYEDYAKKLAEANKLTNAIASYELAVMKARDAEDHWFGNSALQNLNDSWKQASKASESYYKVLNEQQAAYRNQTKHDGDWLGNVIAGSVAGAITGAMMGVEGGLYGMAAGAAIGGIIGGAAGATTSYAEQMLGNSKYDKNRVSAKDNLRIETRKKKKSFMWIGGHDQKTQDLRSWAREQFDADLFDTDGWVNTELANKIMDEFGEKLTGETEETLQKLVELKEEYDEYKKQLKDYVSSLYEPLVENMTSAIWEWYDSGRDALARFKEDASSTFRAIVNDLLKQVVLQKVFGAYEDEILGLYEQYNSQAIDETTLMQMVANKTSTIMDTYESTIPILENMVTTIGDTLKENGIDLQDPSSSSGGRGGSSFASASQDSIDETNGRLTAIEYVETMIYGQLVDLNSSIISMIIKSSETSNSIEGISRQLAETYLELTGIHDDTTAIRTATNAIAGLLRNDFYKHITKL